MNYKSDYLISLTAKQVNVVQQLERVVNVDTRCVDEAVVLSAYELSVAVCSPHPLCRRRRQPL